jgi:hypothetical protein
MQTFPINKFFLGKIRIQIGVIKVIKVLTYKYLTIKYSRVKLAIYNEIKNLENFHFRGSV